MRILDFRKLIELFPDRNEFGRAAGVDRQRVRSMYGRNSIGPAHVFELFVNAGDRMEQAGITPLDVLELYHRRRKARAVKSRDKKHRT
jgi:hypothetical protein